MGADALVKHRTRTPLAVRAAWTAWGAGMEAATWLALAPLEVLGRCAGRDAPGGARERLGISPPTAPPTAPSGRAPWLVHAVSAGEMAAASALVAEMEGRGAGLRAVLTTGTAAGRAVALRIAREHPATVVAVSTLPWDRPHVLRRWLSAIGPEAVVVVEAEIWPGLFDAARRLGIPLAIASGRMTPGESLRYALARGFFSDVLSAARWIGVQSSGDVERFAAAGAAREVVEAAGNLKWDVAPGGGDDLPGAWGEALAADGSRHLVVGGSTHAPEEKILLEAFLLLRARHPALRLVLAPRRTDRAERIARSARRRGLRAALLSGPAAGPDAWDVLVVDAWGSLPALYRRAFAAFVGGSAGRRGGQSPIEPAIAGIPAVMGPSDGNFRAAAELLEASGALLRVRPKLAPAPLAETLGSLLDDAALAGRRGVAGRETASRARGAAALAVDRVLGLVVR